MPRINSNPSMPPQSQIQSSVGQQPLGASNMVISQSTPNLATNAQQQPIYNTAQTATTAINNGLQQQVQQQQTTGVNQQPVTLINQQPTPPRQSKPWHEKITTDMRKHLIQKIVQTIFPTQDPKIYTDPRLNNLVNYAVRTECDMYEAAKDQEEYFHLLAERIYKIQKEFEDKQKLQRSQSRSGSTSGAPGSANSGVNAAGDTNGIHANNGTAAQQPHSGIASSHSDFQTQLNQLNAYNSGKLILLIFLLLNYKVYLYL